MPKRKAPSSDSASPDPDPDPRSRRGTRHATVYDAVANRVNYEGFVHSRRVHDTNGELHKRSQTAQTADEVLGRRRNAPEAPIPYAEGGGEGLPDSDLLIAVHQYVADFYGAHGMGAVSYRSMDETALLAVGMLLEETVKSCLGEDGDLALIEQESSSEEEDAEEQAPAESPPKKKKKRGKDQLGIGF
ncbi:uncharacterized protein LAJ45_02301 [Morchella importuna]|uniref:uncharacterized protein n=1 Tax=Morchella importuna TaxID=1174673 RepID=UPI001E8EDEE1|nr:uncharacterized protein LAJ45_02301 [Morchella importuna]KAH8153488.1 hypothetical protein LAJ45_02301 [Morchella importuna]